MDGNWEAIDQLSRAAAKVVLRLNNTHDWWLNQLGPVSLV